MPLRIRDIYKYHPREREFYTLPHPDPKNQGHFINDPREQGYIYIRPPSPVCFQY